MDITLTLMTCKRFPLFERALRSFRTHCLDAYLIKKVVCIDDNSSDEDIQKMRSLIKELFPVPSIFATKTELKGQAASMNFLWSVVTTPFIFHLEDDWEFTRSGKFITEAFEIFEKHPVVKQSLLVDGVKTDPVHTLPGGYEYTVHNWKRNGHWWANLSFRPGVYDIAAMKEKVGLFRSHIGNSVELDYSIRYSEFFESAYSNVSVVRDMGAISAFGLNNCNHRD